MKAIVEFGVRGGKHTKHVCPNAKQAANLAASMAFVFGETCGASRESYFDVSRSSPRVSWQSSTHFVSVSLLDGVPRGDWYDNGKFAYDRFRRDEAAEGA
jgi:hypothetical protein